MPFLFKIVEKHTFVEQPFQGRSDFFWKKFNMSTENFYMYLPIYSKPIYYLHIFMYRSTERTTIHISFFLYKKA